MEADGAGPPAPDLEQAPRPAMRAARATTSSPTGPATSSAGTGVVRALPMTPQVREQLLEAAAAAKQVPAAQFAGLDPAGRYYARDEATGTSWAAAALLPRATSTAAQISVQDNGSYDLFEKPPDRRWLVFEVGQAGVGGTRCPVEVPAAVVRAWGWAGLPAGSPAGLRTAGRRDGPGSYRAPVCQYGAAAGTSGSRERTRPKRSSCRAQEA